MPANVFLFAGTKNFCPGTRMARSYNTCNRTKGSQIKLRRGKRPALLLLECFMSR
jgi:hypothetical protein